MHETMTSREAADALRVPAETLRYWERVGLLPPVGRDSGRRRRYSPADLRFVDVIRCLRITDMPIRAVREFTDLVRQGPDTASRRLALLRRHRAEVLGSLAERQRALEVIDEKIAAYEAMTGEPSRG